MICLCLRRGGWLGLSVLLGCAGLIGCGTSPPTRFYILNEIAPTAAATATSNAATNASTSASTTAVTPSNVSPTTPPVQLVPVAIAPELDRPELVTRSGPNRVHVADFERWAAPLADQIRRVLSDDLAARLAPGLIVSADEPAGSEPRRTLSVAIDEFYGDESCAVSLRAGWSLSRPNAASLHGTEQLQIPGSAPCGEQLPAAMSRALAALADRLASVIAAD
jgi:uncharacterized lipoprotein YmbA